jgi:hypothetical protein
VETETLAKILIATGVLVGIVGVVLLLLTRAGFSGFPGDLSFKSDGVSIYIPIVSMIVASIILTIVVNIALRLFNR